MKANHPRLTGALQRFSKLQHTPSVLLSFGIVGNGGHDVDGFEVRVRSAYRWDDPANTRNDNRRGHSCILARGWKIRDNGQRVAIHLVERERESWKHTLTGQILRKRLEKEVRVGTHFCRGVVFEGLERVEMVEWSDVMIQAFAWRVERKERACGRVREVWVDERGKKERERRRKERRDRNFRLFQILLFSGVDIVKLRRFGPFTA